MQPFQELSRFKSLGLQDISQENVEMSITFLMEKKKLQIDDTRRLEQFSSKSEENLISSLKN